MIAETFEDARRIVAARFGPQHPPSAGTFMVADWGQESEHYWRVVYGPRNQLMAESLEEQQLDPIVTFVEKATGKIEQFPMIDSLTALDNMRIVGTPPAELR